MLYCPNFSNKQIKQEFEELRDMFEKIYPGEGEDYAYFFWDKNNGYSLDRYPDGQPSKLYLTVFNDTRNRETALLAAAKHLAEENGVTLQPKSPSQAKYHYGTKTVQVTRQQMEDELEEYYNKAYDFSAKLAEFSIATKTQTKTLRKIFYDSQNADTEDEKNERVAKYVKYIESSKNPYIRTVKTMRLNNGGILVYVKTYTPEELLKQYVQNYIKNLSDDELFSQLQEFEREELYLDMYHINPKRIPELKEQIAKKNPYLYEYQINDAIKFLQELENDKENNAYVECCLNWLKRGAIELPRDNDKIRDAFNIARRHNLDVQKFKSPVDLIVATAEKINTRKENTVDISKISKFKYNSTVLVKGKEVQIYDVEDSEEGQRAVCQLLSDSGMVDQDGNSISFSPWCLSTYNVDKNGVAVPTTSAKHFWKQYSFGKRQIAICEGVPVAFNSSSMPKDEWWDFYDGHDNEFKGYTSIQDIDLSAADQVYAKRDTQNVVDVRIGGNFYSYNRNNRKITSVGIYVNDAGYETGSIYVYSTGEVHVSMNNFFDAQLYFELLPPKLLNIRAYGAGFSEYVSLPPQVYKDICSILGNINIDSFRTRVDAIKILKQITKYKEDIIKAVAAIADKSQTEQQQENYQQEAVVEVQTEAAQEAIVEVAAQQARQDMQEQPSPIRRRLNNNGTVRYTPASTSPYYLPTSFSPYNLISQSDSDYAGLTEEESVEVADTILYDDMMRKYDKYIRQPMNKELAHKLHEILRKYNFLLIEDSLNEVLADDELGKFDVLQKIIYFASEDKRNAIVDAEEFSHAFIKMMGAVYHRPENREKYPETALYSKLRDMIQNTSFYMDVYDQYKKVYTYKNGNVDESKIKEEALGKALAIALIESYENLQELDKSFVKRIKNWFNRVLTWFKSLIGINRIPTLQDELNTIAKDVLNGDYRKYLDKADISDWKQVTLHDTLEKDKTEDNGFGVKCLKFMCSLGAVCVGSLSIRSQGTLYRSGVESLHDLDMAFPLSVHRLHTHFIFNARQWTSEELIQSLENDRITGKILQSIKQEYPDFHIITGFVNNQENVCINAMICPDMNIVERFKSAEGNFNKRLQQFTEEERKKIHLVDLMFNPDDSAKKAPYYEDDITYANYRVPFEYKLQFARAKDLMDYQLWRPFVRETRINESQYMFHKMSQQYNDEQDNLIDQYSVFEQREQLQKEKQEFVDHAVEQNINADLESIEQSAVQAEKEWAEKKQREIIGETQLQLAEAFGLTRQDDGSWTSGDNDSTTSLRIAFVNSMQNPGSIDFNTHSDRVHSLILIGLNKADASTFNHELAHYYIRTFWNSKAVQEALDMVYVKEMGDYKTDENARIAVEEALADYMTQQSLDSMFRSNVESRSFFQRFWESFNKMLYRVFDIKTETAKRAILNQIVSSFLINEQIENNARDIKYVMHDGIMHQTEYQKRKIRKNTGVAYEQLSRSKFENTVNKIVSAIQSKAKSYSVQSVNDQTGVYGDANQAAFNQESVRIVRQFIKDVESSRADKNDSLEMSQKLALLTTFLERADEEIDRTLRLLYNARANGRYQKVMYNVNKFGEKEYDDPATNEPITSANAISTTEERAYTFDDLQYAKNDIVGFFASTIKDIVSVANDAVAYGISQTEAQQILDFVNAKGLISRIDTVESLYLDAQREKCLRWIDETVNERIELDDDFKQRLRVNMYKWLDDQMDFGDVSVFEVFMGMGSMSKSPIIRAIQDKISDMQEERDEQVHHKMLKLYAQLQKAKREMGFKYNWLPFNVQKLLMQLDKFGIPTGNLISKYNRGQYHKDLEQYKNKILFGKGGLEDKLKKLKDGAGNPVCVNEDGSPWKLMLNEYGDPIFPDNPLCYDLEKEYMEQMEMFKSDRTIRRFTTEYYIDRIHTLSIPTLRVLTEIERKIDELRTAVTINGKFRPDLLTDDQQELLRTYYEEREQLSSPYYLDGSPKTPGTDEYNIANELRTWHVMCADEISYEVDMDAYNEAYKFAKNKKQFERNFAKYQINPEIWDYVYSHSQYMDPDDPDYIRLKTLKYNRAKLLFQYQGPEIGEILWDKLYDDTKHKIKNEQVFLELKRLDTEISKLNDILHNRYKGTGRQYDFKSGERLVLDERAIPYHFIPGVTSWSSLSQYQVMLNNIKYSINNDPNLTPMEKQDQIFKIEDLLRYSDAREGAEVPLSIFYAITARQGKKTRMHKGGPLIDSYVVLPGKMFSKVSSKPSKYVDSRFEQAQLEQGEGVLLTDKYIDKRYQKYFESNKNQELQKLLEEVKSTMKDSYESIKFLGNYDGRCAQIGARTGQILGRKWYNIPQLLKNIGEFLRREAEVVETDTDFLQDAVYETRPDGSRINNIPIRFVKRLDDPTYISSDVVGSAIKFYSMAKNYTIKSKNASMLNTILNELSKVQNVVNADLRSGSFGSTQAEVLRGMLDRQVYETKNVSSNSKEYISENPWNHFDWFRKYVLSTPASWVKRVQKSRAAFQLGMLALNMTSGIISFLDPLMSMSIDTITGKYINFKNLAYALGRLFTNLPGNVYSLGSVKSHSKISAAMQRFQLSKSITNTSSDMDQGTIMRFISDGLTMKHFTLGDYTINSINMVATMDNYRYYEKKDGTAGFYPKHLFIKVVMEDLKCDVNKARSIYKSARNMWDSCEVNELGEFVGMNDQYGNAIDKATWNHVKKQVQSRSSIYNGIVPDVEKSLMQTNIIWSFVTMLRNFFIVGIWERFQSYNDFQVASLDENGDPVDRPSTKQQIKDAKKHQRFYKGGFNWSTRMIEDGVDVAASRYIKHLGPYLKYAFYAISHSKYDPNQKEHLKSHNISQTDIYGMQKIFMEVILFITLLLLSSFTMRAAYDDDNKDNYLVQLLNLILVRIAIERATWLNPSTAMDLISSPTAALSDWKRKLKLFDLLYDATGLSDHQLDEIMKNGRYIDAQRWKYNLFNGLSSLGINNWYADMPEELGGGGTKSIKEKTNFYKGLVKSIPFAGPILFPSKKNDDVNASTKGRSSRRQSHRSSSRRQSRN